MDGKTIEKVDDITEIKNAHNIGDKVKLKVYRENKYIDIELTLQEQP